MKSFVSSSFSDHFRSASRTRSSKPKKKRPSPLSIRLSEDERSLLLEMAGTKPLATYVKACLFKGKKVRKSPRSSPVKDQEALARVLARLGKSEIFNSLSRVILAVEEGRVVIQPELEDEIRQSLRILSFMRDDLVRAMGLRS